MTPPALSAAILAMEGAPSPGAGSHSALAENWHVFAIVAAVLVGILILAYLAKYLRLAVNLFLDTPLPGTANLNDYTPPEGEIVTFPSLEGRSLCGMFITRPPGAPDRGTVIFCHEFGSDMTSAGRYASALVEDGYTVFTFDFRGHGRSFAPARFEPRYWPSNYEVHDILAAIAFVRSRRDVDTDGIGIVGISRGASAAVVAAALNANVRCLVVDSVFSTDHRIDGLVKRWVQIFAKVDLARADRSMTVYRLFRALTMFYVELKCRCRFPSARRALVKLDTVPILFIHGERDAYVPVEQTQVLYDVKPGPKEIWICPGAKHNQAVAVDPRTYHRNVTAFFKRHLSAEAADASTGAGAE